MWKSETRGAQTGREFTTVVDFSGDGQQLEAQMMILAASSPFFCFWRPGKNDQLAQIGEEGGKALKIDNFNTKFEIVTFLVLHIK